MEVSAMVDPTMRRLEDELAQLVFLAAAGVLLAVGYVAWWAIRHPRTSLILAALTAAYVALDAGGFVVVCVGLAIVAALWRWAHRASFDWFILGPWRRGVVYGWRWRKAMTMADLGDTYPGRSGVGAAGPGALRAEAAPGAVGLLVRPGQRATAGGAAPGHV
jgi:hypothetical protein